MSWQPIDTAPKMFTVLMWGPTHIAADGTVKNWKMATGFWHTGYENDEAYTPWCWDGQQLRPYSPRPTHWMHLPEPPEAQP